MLPFFRSSWITGIWILFAAAVSAQGGINIVTPAGYVPNVPFLVRVELTNESGAIAREIWDAEAFLFSDNPGVTLSTNKVVLRNGLGTALVTLNGSADFKLTVKVNGNEGTRAVQSLAAAPIQEFSGTLTGAETVWGGVVRVSGNLTVPVGHTLTISSNTLVMVDGVASGTTGIRILVNGTVNSLGTALHPVVITCANPGLNWGQIVHESPVPSRYEYTFFSKAGRAPGEGHTGTGPAIRPRNSTVTFQSCVISDLTYDTTNIGKIMMGSDSSVTFRDCVLARARMGPELAGTGVVCDGTWITDMYGPDDSDGIYLHNAAGKSIELRNGVIASGNDDAIDTLNADVTVENCIIRDWPNPAEDAKGISVFHGNVSLKRCLLANVYVGASAKSSGPATLLEVDHCTIISITQGVAATYKDNATAGNITINVSNSIVKSPDALSSDFGPEKFASVTFNILSEAWPGLGNLVVDPLFVNESAGDYHLQPGSPAIDAGDPSYPLDEDGSRSDIGYYKGTSSGTGFFAMITAPAAGSTFYAPTNLTVSAAAVANEGTVESIDIYEGTNLLARTQGSPGSAEWNVRRVGSYSLTAVARHSSGLVATSGPVNVNITAGPASTTNVLVAAGSEWRYLDNGSDQGTTWIQESFNDSGWALNKGEFGYGDGDEITPISFGPNSSDKYPTTYFRKNFVLSDAAGVQTLVLGLLRDDGAVVYLNGREAFRISMPVGLPNYRTYATSAVDYNWERVELSPAFLKTGTNMLAVEVHQGSRSSSDLSFDLELIGMAPAPTNVAPYVSLLSPADGSVYGSPAQVQCSAEAFDVDGNVSEVVFYANEVEIGRDSTAPYAIQWYGAATGSYLVKAVAQDDSGLRKSTGESEVTISGSVLPPTIVQISPNPGLVTNFSAVTLTFSQEVTGVDAGDLLLNGVAATQVTGSGKIYTFEFAPSISADAHFTWAENHQIQDIVIPPGSFEAGAVGATWSYRLIDTIAPTLRSITPSPGATVASLLFIEVLFSEPVTNVRAGDFLLADFPAVSVTGSGAGPYRFAFAQALTGSVEAGWAASQNIRDSQGNLFQPPPVWRYTLNPSFRPVVISEIMYHPKSERPQDEWIELRNLGVTPVDLTNWRISDGVEFVLPSVILGPGEYLVIAADVAAFRTQYPSVQNVVGGWLGQLSNTGEEIEVRDANNSVVTEVRYADEGDWAVRRRGTADLGQRGWSWYAEHDGLGDSLELINPVLSSNNGQNWGASVEPGGTPGRANTLNKTNIAPLVEGVSHFPLVPSSTQAVTITARAQDELDLDVTMKLFYRLDTLPAGSFAEVVMNDSGTNGDAARGDGFYTAIIPPQPNNAVVEFYVLASDSTGLARTWPAPVLAALDGVGPEGQVVNALYQVDDSTYEGEQPLYKIILTEAERQQLANIHNNIGGSANSDAQMNATFISIEAGAGERHYLAGIRNRGHGTRTRKPNNVRVNFRTDDRWKGVVGINLNGQFSWLQTVGAALNLKARVPGAYSRAVQLRVNNQNLALTGGTDRTYGSYAANEVINSDWAENHYPLDGEGNIYRANRDIAPSDFDYRTLQNYPTLFGPENANSYTNTWSKESNRSENDWTDLFAMLRVFGPSGTDPYTVENIGKVINIDQWLRHLAVMNILGNSETGLNSGYNDDYYTYRGIKDPRFILVYYDLDQILGINNGFASNASLFSAGNISSTARAGAAFARFLAIPEIRALYFTHLQDLINGTFSAPEFNATVEQVLGSYVPEVTRTSLKTWMDSRRAYVQSQLPAGLAFPPRAVISGTPRSPTAATAASFVISGERVSHYRYSLNGAPFSAELPFEMPLLFDSLPSARYGLRVIARDASGNYQLESMATRASWVVNSTWPSLRLNEVIASQVGNLPDQLELYNEGSVAIDLNGFSVTDNPSVPGKKLLSGSLPPGGYLVLDAQQLGFSFDASGEAAYLYQSTSSGMVVRDSVVFGQQLSGYSLGRISGGGEWYLASPTPNAANLAAPVGNPKRVRINEWLAVGVSPWPNDFVELFNPELLPVGIGDFYLTDSPLGNPGRSKIRPYTFISGGGFLAFTSGNGNNPGEINFGLSGEQGEVALLTEHLEPVDQVVYSAQQVGYSVGRCPDGGTTQKKLSAPTPFGPNLCPAEPPPPVLVTLVASSNTWRFDSSGVAPSPMWNTLAFDASSWRSGPGPLGFESDPLPEPIRTAFPEAQGIITAYFRTDFDLSPETSSSTLRFTRLIDDGAAFYLNGVEIPALRYNLAVGATHQTTASATVDNARFETVEVPASGLQPGRNVLAVEVHQVNSGSADLVFGLKLEALVYTNNAAAAGVVLNEVLANNATVTDTAGKTPDWIELFNPSTNSVDLGGLRVTTDLSNPTPFGFPTGSIIPAGGYYLLTCSENNPVSATNTGFALKAEGGSIYLLEAEADGGGIISSISYGLQAVDFSIGRIPDGSSNWVLNLPTPAAANRSISLGNLQALRINEWMASPSSGEDWFELYNSGPEPLDLSGVWLSDSLARPNKHLLPQLSFLGTGLYAYLKLDADEKPEAGADHVNFKLSGTGESIVVSSRTGVLEQTIAFGPQLSGVSEGKIPDGAVTVVSFSSSSSPGKPNYLPLEEVVINEILTHTDEPFEDAVEIRNNSSQVLDIGGWYLSDSGVNLRKYQIPPNTTIAPGGFRVFYESQFNSDLTSEPFAFSSAKGEQVYLSEANRGFLTGYRASASFGPALNGVSFGRIETSQGPRYVPLLNPTFGKDNPSTLEDFRTGLGSPNSAPRIGPVVISEVMYHPPGTNDVLEFIELRNISSQTLVLHDPAHPTNSWRINGEVEFTFARETVLLPGAYLVVVGFDPQLDSEARAHFENAYGTGALLVGPWLGNLNNASGSIALEMPDTPQVEVGPDFGFVPMVEVDRVDYRDEHPWPAAADGLGPSLQRSNLAAYGNEPLNWLAFSPTPGRPLHEDRDADGLPDAWETEHGLDPRNADDAAWDDDLDGLSNHQEFLAGTDPQDPLSSLEVQIQSTTTGTVLFFRAAPGRNYQVEFCDALAAGNWATLLDIPASPSGGILGLPVDQQQGNRFFRVRLRE